MGFGAIKFLQSSLYIIDVTGWMAQWRNGLRGGLKIL